jgi:hypothetical protein
LPEYPLSGIIGIIVNDMRFFDFGFALLRAAGRRSLDCALDDMLTAWDDKGEPRADMVCRCGKRKE